MYILKSNEFAILIYSLKTLEIWTYDPIRNNFQEYSLNFFLLTSIEEKLTSSLRFSLRRSSLSLVSNEIQ
jgi:hypothetical protein